MAGTAVTATGPDPLGEAERLMGPARLAYFTPVREYPPLADRKASVLLAVEGVMFVVLSSLSDPLYRLLHHRGPAAWLGWLAVATWFVLAALGVGFAIRALTRPIPAMDSLAYFRHIANTERVRDRADYHRLVRERTHPEALRDILHYNYSLAALSVEKFALVNRAVAFVCSAYAAWMVVLTLLTFVRPPANLA